MSWKRKWTWETWFRVESVALLGLCAHGLWAPGRHLAQLLGLGSTDPVVMPLAHLITAALCAWTWLYLRLVLGGAEVRTFRRIQEGLTLGHILLLAAGLGILAELNPEPWLFLTFMLANLAGLAMRLTYLVHTREVPWPQQIRTAPSRSG